MTHQEFYEKYWTVDGKEPPPLREMDIQLFNAFYGLKDGEEIVFQRFRNGIYRLMKYVPNKPDTEPLNNSSNGE